MNTIFITGGTGFIGSNLILRFLLDTDAEIVALARPDDKHSGTARIERALGTASSIYPGPLPNLDEVRQRVHVMEASLDQSWHIPQNIESVWHCAASLKHKERDREEIDRVNVDGTRTLLDRASDANVASFNYMSTAYVAGTRQGLIPEQLDAHGDRPQNQYERSKISAELAVAEHPARFQRTIWRPSIVTGHSTTLQTTSDFGLYGFVQQLLRFQRQSQWAADILKEIPLKIIAEDHATLNFTPIDLLTQQAVSIPRSSLTLDVVHLTNARTLTVRDTMDAIFQEVGVPEPQLVSDSSGFSRIDSAFDRGIDFYRSYISGVKDFRQEAASSRGQHIEHEMNQDTVRHLTRNFIEWYGYAVPRQGRTS